MEITVAEVLTGTKKREQDFISDIYKGFTFAAAIHAVVTATLLLLEVTILGSLHFEDNIILAAILISLAVMIISYTIVSLCIRHKINYSINLFHLKEALDTTSTSKKAVIKKMKQGRKRATLLISYEDEDCGIRAIKLRHIKYMKKTSINNNITTGVDVESKRYFELDIKSYKNIVIYEKGEL